MDARMRDFLERSHLMSLSVVECIEESAESVKCNDKQESFKIQNDVYCASCYYAFCAESLSLCFKSDEESRHIKLAEENPYVGVIVAKDSKVLGAIEGLQIKAYFKGATLAEEKIYYAKFPFAKLGHGRVFALKILWAKYTNNALLLQEKLIYTAKELS